MAEKEPKLVLVEMISAYLDDELTSGQVQKLEKRLAVDPSARRLLAELRQNAELLRAMPVAKPGADLTDNVLNEIERDILLDPGQALAELAGRKHLRLRRFVAAAAIIMLTFLVGSAIYTVLDRPQLTDLVAKDSGRNAPLKKQAASAGAAEMKSADVGVAAVRAENLRVGKPRSLPVPAPLPSIESAQPRLSKVNMIIRTDEPDSVVARVARIFADVDQPVIRKNIGWSSCQFTVVLPMAQARALFEDITDRYEKQIQLDVSDFGESADSRLVVDNASLEQISLLAEEVSPARQLLLAEAFPTARRINPEPVVQAEKDDFEPDNYPNFSTSASDLFETFAYDISSPAVPEKAERSRMFAANGSPGLSRRSYARSGTYKERASRVLNGQVDVPEADSGEPLEPKTLSEDVGAFSDLSDVDSQEAELERVKDSNLGPAQFVAIILTVKDSRVESDIFFPENPDSATSVEPLVIMPEF